MADDPRRDRRYERGRLSCAPLDYYGNVSPFEQRCPVCGMRVIVSDAMPKAWTQTTDEAVVWPCQRCDTVLYGDLNDGSVTNAVVVEESNG